MKLKKIFALSLAAVAALSLAACGGGKSDASSSSGSSSESSAKVSKSNTSGEGKEYKIGVIQYAPHDALDASNKGFFEALKDEKINYKADQQNAAGEQNACMTIAEKLVNDKNDLIFSIATPAAQAVAGLTKDIPIVLTAVTDPADAGLVKSNEKPETNVTGTSDLTPVAEQIALVKKVKPDAKKVGLLYCSAEANSEFQIKLAKEACKADGLDYEELTISSTNEIQTVVESAIGKVDVIYAPTDNMVAKGMATVSMVANDNKIPTIVGEPGMVENGGLITYGIDYESLGYQAGQMAAKILKDGADPASMPVEYLDKDKCTVSVNEKTAKALGLDADTLKSDAES